jgi:hypothetical protein
MATFTKVLLNCQTASYGELFNLVDYILLAPLEGEGVYFGFDSFGRPTATIYVHLRAGGALGEVPGPAAQQMIYHQCRLVEFAIITRAIRDLPSTEATGNARATFVSVVSAGINAAAGGGVTGTYTATLHKHTETVLESSVGAQSNSIRALEAAHHAMATVVSATDELAAVRAAGAAHLFQNTTNALGAITSLARGHVVINDSGGRRVGVRYVITGGNGPAPIPEGVSQLDINEMSKVVAASIRRQAFQSGDANGRWWGGLPRMFHEFVRTHAAIAPGSPDINMGSVEARAAAQAAVNAAAGIARANNIRTFWVRHPNPGAATATLQMSAPDPTPATPTAVWGAGLYVNNPNWTLLTEWGTIPADALNLVVLRRDNVVGRNPPHLVNTPPHADEVLARVRVRANLLGVGRVEMDGGLAQYRQDHLTRQTTPPWIAAAVAMIRFLLLLPHTLVVGRRSSILEAAYVSGIAVYVIGDDTPGGAQRNWDPIFTQETEQNPAILLDENDLVPIGTWRRPRKAPFPYLSTRHRDLAYRILNNHDRLGAAPYLYPQPLGQFHLGGKLDDYLIYHQRAGNNTINIEVTAEIAS